MTAKHNTQNALIRSNVIYICYSRNYQRELRFVIPRCENRF